MLKYVILIHTMGSTIHLKNVVPFSLASMFSCEKPGITQAVIPLRIAHCFVAVIFLSYFRCFLVFSFQLFDYDVPEFFYDNPVWGLLSFSNL